MIRCKLIKLLYFLFILTLPGVSLTNSSFTDESMIASNVVSVGFWEDSDHKDPQLVLSVSKDKKSASFRVDNIKKFNKLFYELTYDADGLPQGIIGETVLDKQDSFSQNNIILGTCSADQVCVYQKDIHNLNLKVTLKDKNGQTLFLSKLVRIT